MKIIASSIEALESRIAPAAFIVTTLKDLTNAAHDTGSFRDAIFNANATVNADDEIDAIVFQKPDGSPLTGTIKLLSDLPIITDGVAITGSKPGKATGIIIDGNKHHIFDIDRTNSDVELTDLTIKNGQSSYGGGLFIHNTGATVKLTDVTVSGNRAIAQNTGANGGGGMAIGFDSKVMISKSKITGNFSIGTKGDAGQGGGDAYGGGIFCNGELTISDSVISGNTAKGGAALAGTNHSGGKSIGGGISSNLYAVTIKNSTISGNRALGGNGAKGVQTYGGSGGDSAGGGVYSYGGPISITNSVISRNISKGGIGGAGGQGLPGGDGGDALGGGVATKRVDYLITIETTTISGNTATGAAGGAGGGRGLHGEARGGGVYLGAYSTPGAVTTLALSNSTISGNTSSFGRGGGIFVADGTAAISQSTIAKNIASGDGGGFEIAKGTVKVHNSTVAKNKSIRGSGGGMSVNGGATPVEIISTIIAGNTAKTDADLSSVGFGINLSFSLLQKVTAGSMLATDTSNVKDKDPLLGALRNNGGPTFTMIARTGSVVVDAGSNPDGLMTDQRGPGFDRVQGPLTDIGAAEG